MSTVNKQYNSITIAGQTVKLDGTTGKQIMFSLLSNFGWFDIIGELLPV